MITTKTLLTGFSILAATLALAPIAPQALAASATSSLTISNDIYIPTTKTKVEKKMMSETDSMPITEEAPYRTIQDALTNAPHAPAVATAEPESMVPTAQKAPQTINILKTTNNAPAVNTVASWRARNGENLQDIITRWGERIGMTYTWTTSDNSTIHNSYSDFGSYEEAIYKLLVRENKPRTYIQEHTMKIHQPVTSHAVKKNN